MCFDVYPVRCKEEEEKRMCMCVFFSCSFKDKNKRTSMRLFKVSHALKCYLISHEFDERKRFPWYLLQMKDCSKEEKKSKSYRRAFKNLKFCSKKKS